MTQLPNQFSQSAVKGMPDLRFSGNTISCQMDTSTAGSIPPGTGVVIVDNAGGVPKVVEATADTDLITGYISYNQKQATYDSGDAVEVVLDTGVIYLEASAAIARGAKIMPVIAGSKVATATTGKPISGVAIDKAAADGDLIRVYVKSFGFEAVP